MQSRIKLYFTIASKGYHLAALTIAAEVNAVFTREFFALIEIAFFNHKGIIDFSNFTRFLFIDIKHPAS